MVDKAIRPRGAVLVAMLVALLCRPALAQDAPQDQPGDFHITLIEDYLDGEPVARVNVNGRQVVVGLNTSNAPDLVLTRRLCDRIGARVFPLEHDKNGVLVRLGQDAQGRVLSEPLPLYVYEVTPDIETQGMVGWQAIRQHIWELDQPNQRHTFLDTLPEEVDEGWQSFPIRDNMGALAIAMTDADGQEMLIHFDIVSDSQIALGTALWERWLEENRPEWFTLAGIFSPSPPDYFFVQEQAIVSRFELAGLAFEDVIVNLESARPLNDGSTFQVDGSISLRALADRRVIIDGPGERVYFGPRVEPADADAGGYININRAQATYIPRGLERAFPTARVIEGGVAHRAGLRDGDTVVMVNGRMADNWAEDTQVRPSSVFNDPPGTRVRLVVERGGEHVSIAFELGRCPLDPDEAGQAP